MAYMGLSVAATFLLLLLDCVFACNIAATGPRKPRKPIPGVHVVEEPMADVWLGAVEFADFFCGLPEGSPEATAKPTAQPLQFAPAALHADVIALNMKLPTGKVNPYKFDHSFVYFRGQTFEWGASVMLDYGKGNIGRDPHQCPTVWGLQRGSNCTLVEAGRLAKSFGQIHGAYSLLTNNCHHFAEWLMKKLIAGNCKL